VKTIKSSKDSFRGCQENAAEPLEIVLHRGHVMVNAIRHLHGVDCYPLPAVDLHAVNDPGIRPDDGKKREPGSKKDNILQESTMGRKEIVVSRHASQLSYKLIVISQPFFTIEYFIGICSEP